MTRAGWPFFDDREAAHLREPHRFRTVDLSLVSRLLEPYWQWCADRVPASIAPNAITLTGFLLVLGVFVAMLAENSTLSAAPSPGVCAAAIASIFAFQTLDAIDGKQARKTGSSSALGNWIDHACDVASVQLAMATAGASIGLGAGPALLFLLGSIIVNNFVTHWETRHTGTLHMGNGTSIYEAQLTMMAVHGLTLAVGPALWARPIAALVPALGGLPCSEAPLRLWVVVLGVGLIGGIGMVGSIVRVRQTVGLGESRAAELVAPFALVLAGGLALRALDERSLLPVTFAVSLLGLRLIAAQILGQLGGGRVRAFDLALVPMLLSSFAYEILPRDAAALLAWANLAFACVVAVGTYVGATLAIARVLDLPVLTLPPARTR